MMDTKVRLVYFSWEPVPDVLIDDSVGGGGVGALLISPGAMRNDAMMIIVDYSSSTSSSKIQDFRTKWCLGVNLPRIGRNYVLN